MGWTYWEECYWGWVKDTDKALNLAEECVQNALSTSTPYPSTYSLQGYLHMERNEWDLAISSCVKATELAPSDSGVFALLGEILR